MAALAELDRPQREVVVLHYLVDLSVAEIAATLGIAQGTVKSRLSRSRSRLAPLLTAEEREDA
jgi:RNA polymerase sigma factor (sigma-70 family)